jgi:hypothetical protein
MFATRRSLPILILTVFLCTIAFSGVIRDGSLTASSNGTDITIRWVSEDETGVMRYELERKAGAGQTGQFMLLDQIQLKGNNSSYEYVDNSAFRAMQSVYQYRVKVLFTNGTSVYYGPITVAHSVNSVRRTWGSIKAMFR